MHAFRWWDEKNYFELEKQSDLSLETATSDLKNKQKSLEEISKKLANNNESLENINFLKQTQQKLINSNKFINEGNNTNAKEEISAAISLIQERINKIENW